MSFKIKIVKQERKHLNIEKPETELRRFAILMENSLRWLFIFSNISIIESSNLFITTKNNHPLFNVCLRAICKI